VTSLSLSLPYLLSDVLLAVLAFTAGILCTLWYGKYALAQSGETFPRKAKSASSVQPVSELNHQERAQMAVLQLRDLTRNVAQDVGTHKLLVSGISDRLGSMTDSAPDLAQVTEAVADIIFANGQLQSRLEIAERKIETQQDELRSQQTEARTDPLTKLANRRELDECLQKQIGDFQQSQRPFSVLMFDVDRFKRFNDTHGHLAGDQVLRSVATAFRKSAKSTDLACRYGGEEFALIMPGTSIGQGRLAAERVRKAIEQLRVNFEGKSLSVTSSVGVAEFSTEDNANDIFRRADEAVYAAKTAGRNCSFWHDGSQSHLIEATNVDGEVEGSQQLYKSDFCSPKIAVSYKKLPDREAFSTELGRRLAESHRFGLPLTLMFLKVQGYSRLEEEYGYAVGEMLLDTVAQSVRSTLRDMDLLARLDSGEFIVMLPGSTVKEASLVGARVQTMISNCAVPAGLQRIRFPVHQGITDVKPQDDANSLIERAKELVTEVELAI